MLKQLQRLLPSTKWTRHQRLVEIRLKQERNHEGELHCGSNPYFLQNHWQQSSLAIIMKSKFVIHQTGAYGIDIRIVCKLWHKHLGTCTLVKIICRLVWKINVMLTSFFLNSFLPGIVFKAVQFICTFMGTPQRAHFQDANFIGSFSSLHLHI